MTKIVNGASLHKGQQRVVDLIKGPAKYVTAVAPRQTGKTFLSIQTLLYWAINDPGCTIFFVSPTYAQAFKPLDELYNAIVKSGIVDMYNKASLTIVLKNKSKIVFKSTERSDNLRGYTVDYMIVDESAYHKEGVWDSVLKPMLLVKGKKVLFISTPRGTNNWFYKMYQLGQDREATNYASTRMEYSENPFLDVHELEEARRVLPAHIFAAEYEGSFTESGNTVFDMSKVIQFPIYPRATGKIYCGVDLGRANDWTVAVFVDSLGNVVDIYRDNQKDWSVMTANIIQKVQQWKAVTWVETNSIGDVIYEMIKKKWMETHPFTTSNKSKNDAIEGLAVDLSSGEVKIPNQELIPALHFELAAYEYEYSPKTRSIKYGAPQGLHDDCVMGLAIANACRKANKTSGQYAVGAVRLS
jgi:hypothetical protein